MALLLRTVLRHRTVGLPLLSNALMRPLSNSKVIFASEVREQKPSSLTRSTASDNSDVSTEVRPIGERIKETTKTTGYVGVIVIGAVIICVLGSAIAYELWSKSSPNGVYTRALAECIDDPRVQDALGTPIKGFGEETRRRRRNHVAHLLVDRHGQTYIQMHFYIQGTRNKATVQLEKRMSDDKYRYLMVQLNHYPHTAIIIEDNRAFMDLTTPIPSIDSLSTDTPTLALYPK